MTCQPASLSSCRMWSVPPLTTLLIVSFCTGNNVQLSGTSLEKENKLPHDQCGKSLNGFSRSKRQQPIGVFGGSEVRTGEFPWVGLIGWTKNGTISYGCGGTLITDRYIVTAAHCLDRPKEEVVVKVWLGGIMWNPDTEDKSRMKEFNVAKKTIHERWSRSKMTNDIGLVKLMETVQFNAFIRPICLPSAKIRSKTLYGETTVAAGWGKTEKWTKPSFLLKVSLPVPDQDKCKSKFQEAAPQSVLDDRVICAGGELKKDTCADDSGGPLMWTPAEDEAERKWYLVGVVSWGKGSGREGLPGVYTRVSYFMEWIMNHMDHIV